MNVEPRLQWLLNQQVSNLKSVEDANSELATQAEKIWTFSTSSIAVVVGLHLLPTELAGLTNFHISIVATLAVSAVAMVALAIAMHRPRASKLPATGPLDLINRAYIQVDDFAAFNQAMNDYEAAFKLATSVNASRSRILSWMIYLVAFQVVFVTGAVVYKAYASTAAV